jgi:hypothetical protein
MLTMETAILNFSAEIERKFSLLPADISAEYDGALSDAIRALDAAQNAVAALNPAFRRAGLGNLEAVL